MKKRLWSYIICNVDRFLYNLNLHSYYENYKAAMQEISSKHKNSVYVKNVNALDVKICCNLRLIYRTIFCIPFSALL